MKLNFEPWLKRAEEILKKDRAAHYDAAGEVYQFATSMLAAVYGPESPQMKAMRADADAISKGREKNAGDLFDLSFGVIRNVKGEIEAGLIENWRAQVAGELLAELVRLGKEILAEQTEESKNVAAVLIAASFEGTLRRMGEELAGMTARPALHEVVSLLKNVSVLKGSEVHTANGYLKFRNDSLHADWKNVDRFQIEGCTLFVESLLGKHFS